MEMYITDLKAYNEGALVGFWLDADNDASVMASAIEEWLEERTEETGELREEWFVTDYEDMAQFGEYPNLDEIAAYVEACDEYDQEVVDAALSLDIPLESIANAYMGEYDSEIDWAHENFWELQGISESDAGNISMYIDYESYARDVFMCDLDSVESAKGIHVFFTHY